MNVCIFSRSFWPNLGGLESIGHLLATAISEEGHSVQVVTDTPGPVSYERRRYGIRRTSSFFGRYRALREADVVLFMNVSLPGLVAATCAQTPVVISHHGIHKGSGLKGLIAEWIKIHITRFYTNICVSEFVARQVPGRSTIIGNAYDEEIFVQSTCQREVDFVFCGRLVSEKGVDLCIRAFAKVLETQNACTLSIIGDGPERVCLEDLAAELRISDSVRFLGPLKGYALAETLQRHRCLVVPSVCEEGFGIVALEGLACCQTVVATRRGGLPEAVGPFGTLVEPNTASLSQAMLESVQRASVPLHTDVSSETAQNLRQHLKSHSPKIVARKYIEVLREVLSGQ